MNRQFVSGGSNMLHSFGFRRGEIRMAHQKLLALALWWRAPIESLHPVKVRIQKFGYRALLARNDLAGR